MTVLPNLMITGIFAIISSAAFGATAIVATTWRHGGWMLMGLSLLTLLFGGGLGPSLMGALLGIATVCATARSPRPLGRARRALARLWSTFTVVGVAGYLALMPGTVLLAQLTGIENATLVILFAGFAFGGFLLALPAARAADRLHALAPWPAGSR